MTLVGLFLSLAVAVPEVIPVRTQAEFDAFPEKLENLLPETASVRVEFGPGTFFFKDNHLDLSGLSCAGVEVVLSGNDTRLVAADGGSAVPFSPGDGWVDLEKDTDVSRMGPVHSALFYPIPALRHRGRFRLLCQEPDLSEEEAADVYMVLTQWFQGALYKVVKIAGEIALLEKVGEHPTAWYTELRFGRCLPRYRMINHPVDRPAETPHRSLASTFCRVDGCRLGAFRTEGIRFLGNRAGEPLFLFRDFQADSTVVSGCSFEGIRSTVVVCEATDHVRFRDNEMARCYRGGLAADPESADVRVERNVFRDMGLALTNAPAVLCKGPEYRIGDNVFEDFAYSAVGVGTHFTETEEPVASGVVEDNEIYMTEAFRRKPMRMLIDSGAIYIWTQNAGSVIRHNYIHDIHGHHGNRGIFGDDGVLGVRIEDNLVLDVHPSMCIDLRKRHKVQRMRGSKVEKANVANRVTGNVVNGRCRLYIRKDDPDSYIGENLTLPAGTTREEALELWKQWTGR